MSKSFVEQVAHGGYTFGAIQQAAIALTAAQDEQTIVNIGAGQRVVVEKIELVPAAAGTIAFWSGSVAAGTRITGDMALAANAEYVFQDMMTITDAQDLVLSRTTSVAVAGTITYYVLTAT